MTSHSHVTRISQVIRVRNRFQAILSSFELGDYPLAIASARDLVDLLEAWNLLQSDGIKASGTDRPTQPSTRDDL